MRGRPRLDRPRPLSDGRDLGDGHEVSRSARRMGVQSLSYVRRYASRRLDAFSLSRGRFPNAGIPDQAWKTTMVEAEATLLATPARVLDGLDNWEA